ncbi:MAG: nucleotide exchange factor GrpE [Alphaproteobacteria bacterium]|nr:nucleotide exchange factor GrpE [Alphaproteobacteria bacterium]
MNESKIEQPGGTPEAAPPTGEAAATTDAPPPANDAPAPEARIAALEAEVAQLRDQALRAIAETENVRRRSEREREDAGRYAVSRFAGALLDVADSLSQALASASAEPAAAALRQGVELTERTLLGAFEKYGVKRFDPKGEPFDPNLHQAVFEVETADQPAGTVAQVLRTGFMLHGRLLRPAMVAVTKNGPARAAVIAVDTIA